MNRGYRDASSSHGFPYSSGVRTLPALLLRLLLSIALMLDGSGVAMAGGLPLHAPATGAPSHAMHAHSRNCHAQADAGLRQAGHGQATPRHGRGHTMPDCCQPGGCSGACTPTIPAIVGFEWGQPGASLTLPAPPAGGYVAPVRPNLMRPPIA